MVKRRKAAESVQAAPGDKGTPERAAKRRRGAKEPVEARGGRRGDEPGREGLVAEGTRAPGATAAAAGRAQSDDEDTASVGTNRSKDGSEVGASRDGFPGGQDDNPKVRSSLAPCWGCVAFCTSRGLPPPVLPAATAARPPAPHPRHAAPLARRAAPQAAVGGHAAERCCRYGVAGHSTQRHRRASWQDAHVHRLVRLCGRCCTRA